MKDEDIPEPYATLISDIDTDLDWYRDLIGDEDTESYEMMMWVGAMRVLAEYRRKIVELLRDEKHG